MKTYTDLMNEVYSHGDTKKSAKFGVGGCLGKKISKDDKHISNMGDHKVHVGSHGPGMERYTVSDHEGKITNVLTVKKRPHHIHVAVAASTGAGPKMHEFYHHLITKHNKVITTDEQTTGGQHIWKQLAKKGSVNIHGWDPKEKKAVNIDHRLRDHDETHNNETHDHGHAHVTRMQLVAHKK